MVLAMLGGSASVMRVDSAKPGLDNGLFECVATNGLGDPAVAIAVLEVYPEEQGEHQLSPLRFQMRFPIHCCAML